MAFKIRKLVNDKKDYIHFPQKIKNLQQISTKLSLSKWKNCSETVPNMNLYNEADINGPDKKHELGTTCLSWRSLLSCFLLLIL